MTGFLFSSFIYVGAGWDFFKIILDKVNGAEPEYTQHLYQTVGAQPLASEAEHQWARIFFETAKQLLTLLFVYIMLITVIISVAGGAGDGSN
jgi:hypothetical protein